MSTWARVDFTDDGKNTSASFVVMGDGFPFAFGEELMEALRNPRVYQEGGTEQESLRELYSDPAMLALAVALGVNRDRAYTCGQQQSPIADYEYTVHCSGDGSMPVVRCNGVPFEGERVEA